MDIHREAGVDFDYDVLIIGAGVGGHGAALQAVARGLRTAIVEYQEMGGTCINRGCIPSKALLAAAGTLRKLTHTEVFGISVGQVSFDRAKIADHAHQVVTKIRTDLTKSLDKLNVKTIHGKARLTSAQSVLIETAGGPLTVTAQDIIVATGSVPFVPPGIQVDGHTVFTSDEGVRLDWLPQHLCIIGSGYIGLEFSDVFTALGCQVTMIEALDRLLPGFDPDIARMAERVLIKPRGIQTHIKTLAKEIHPGSPVRIVLADGREMTADAVLVATGRIPLTRNLGLEELGLDLGRRGFIPVDDHMATPIPHLWAIGDATGKMMLAHTASAQGAVAVDNICGHPRTVDYQSIPAAVFTHPEIGMVGLTEPQAKEAGYEVATVRTYFGGNSKAIAQAETDGMCKLVYAKDTGVLLGAHILGPEASLLIAECAQAISERATVQRLAQVIHTHPTLSEVLEEAYKRASGV
ncbi:dihydrolipoyl dehydrogenase [Candidatus Cyanaurora vandensis]|uniref:dihydrolipoyl dehydrogenase n=1 Tax=Candidatus Cyanaurora vandensis TaxID=2714958 RepID=UPI00257F2F25|nr:dihydrolipoyl dehydrogenase [Candidatus Cyanaurora vandensis]